MELQKIKEKIKSNADLIKTYRDEKADWFPLTLNGIEVSLMTLKISEPEVNRLYIDGEESELFGEKEILEIKDSFQTKKEVWKWLKFLL